MNVIVSNKNQGLLSSLDVDIIKSINGEFTVDEIIGTFSNFFFNRMFLDITAVKDYKDTANIQKLSMNIDMNKVILLLDNVLMNDKPYLSKLISMGIYNFANNKESLMYLYNHPNSYKDVAHIHELNGSTESSPEPQKKGGLFGSFSSKNTEQNIEKEVALSAKVIGFQNATPSAGATTLIYMLHKYLSDKDYVVSIEVNKNDFGFFNTKNMYSVNQSNLESAIAKFSNAKVVLVDLNGTNTSLCDEVIYLIEPSTIKLGKMMIINKDIFDKMYGHKVVLNKSLLTQNDVSVFEHEANTKISYSIPPLNDHEKNVEVLEAFAEEFELK